MAYSGRSLRSNVERQDAFETVFFFRLFVNTSEFVYSPMGRRKHKLLDGLPQGN